VAAIFADCSAESCQTRFHTRRHDIGKSGVP